VCTGLIGDSVMCLPAIRAARELLPKAELVGLVTEMGRTLLGATDSLDRFVICDGAPLRLRARPRAMTRALERQLAAEAPSLAVIFLGDDYAPLLTRACVPHRVFVAESAFASLATATYSIGDARTWGPEERLGAWRALGLRPRRELPPLLPAPGALRSVAARLQGLPRPWLVIHPFGSTTDQWWPLPAAAAASRSLRERLGGSVFLVGGRKGHAPPARPLPSEMIDLFGQLALEELIALIAMSDCVISTDSGPFHLAGAMGRVGVGLFRASRPEHAGRYPSIATVMAPDLAECRAACRWDKCGFRPCRQMAALSPEAVLDAVGTILPRP
jgi:ADP-heptose:LPS heptosyltransferase